MDDKLKRELVVTGVPAVGVPLIRAYINHRYTMKQLDRQGELAVQVAERRAQGLHAMAGQGGGPQVGRVQPTTFKNPSDVYDELENLRGETDCGFCHNVIDKLMEAPPKEARVGYDELRSYVREVQRIEDQDVSQSEAESLVATLVDGWEVVPKYVSGAA